LKSQLKQYLLIQLNDNTKARIVDKEQDNKFVTLNNGHRIRSHEEIYRWISGKKSYVSDSGAFFQEALGQPV
jgi:polyphosphate kinase